MEAIQKMLETLMVDIKTGLTDVEAKLENTQASAAELLQEVLSFSGPTSTPDSPATPEVFPVIPEANLDVDINVTAMVTSTPTRCSTEVPSHGASELRSPSDSATAPSAIVDVVLLAATTTGDGNLDGMVISDAVWIPATCSCSSGCPRSNASALMFVLVPSARATRSVAWEDVPLGAPTPMEVTCIYVDPGEHRQPPWPPPLICTIRLLCWGFSTSNQAELKPWPGEAQYQYIGVLPAWPPPCENSSLHKLQEILGQAAHLDSQHGNSKGPRGTISLALVSRMLQLHGNLLAPLCFIMFKGQFNASVKWCRKNLLWTVKEWGMDIHWISNAPTWHEQPALHILLQPFLLAHDAKPPWLLHGHETATRHGHRTPVLVGALHVSQDKSVVVFRTLHLPPVCFCIAKDQSKASTKCCCNDLLLRVTDPFVSEYQVTSIPMKMMVRSSELNSFLSSPAPSFVVKIYSDGETAAAYLNLDVDGTYFLCMTTHRKSNDIVLVVYMYWLLQDHVYIGAEVLDMQLLSWFEIKVFTGCDTSISEPGFTILEQLSFPAVDLNTSDAFHCGGENHATEQVFKKNLGGVTPLPSFLQEKGLARYICSISALARMKEILLEACFTCVLRVCTEISMERSMGSDELFPCLDSYHLVECYHSNLSLWDPGGCVLAWCSYEKRWTTSENTALHCSDQLRWLPLFLAYAFGIWLLNWAEKDLKISSGCGQASSQEGRNVTNQVIISDSVHVGHNYYITFVNKIAIGYDYCSDQEYSFDTICSDLLYYRADYHCNVGNIKEVHAPWDPGKSALGSPPKTSAWGQAEFQEGRNVTDPPTPGVKTVFHLSSSCSVTSPPGSEGRPHDTRDLNGRRDEASVVKLPLAWDAFAI